MGILEILLATLGLIVFEVVHRSITPLITISAVAFFFWKSAKDRNLAEAGVH